MLTYGDYFKDLSFSKIMKKAVITIFILLLVFFTIFFTINKNYLPSIGTISGNVVFDGSSWSFSMGNTTVKISDINGNLLNITYKNIPLLAKVSNISMATFKDGTTAYSEWFKDNNRDGLYDIQYKKSTGEIVGSIILNVTEKEDHLLFEFWGMSGMQDFDEIVLFQALPKNASQSKWFTSWAINASNDEPFIDVVALTDNVLCGVEGSPGTGGVWYRCRITQSINHTSAKFAFFVAEKKDYTSTLERVILSYPEPLKAKLRDGAWHRNSMQQTENYLLVVLNQNTCSPEIGGPCVAADIARKGGFETILIIDPLEPGYYNTSIRYDSTDEFYNAIQNIQQKNTSAAIHTFINKVGNRDGLLNFSANPVPFERVLFSRYIGTLASDITSTNGSIFINVSVPAGSIPNLENNTNFSFYYLGQEIRGAIWGREFIIGDTTNTDEIITCNSYTGNTLNTCIRGRYSTGAQNHLAGAPVYILPHHNTNSFHFNPFTVEGRQLQQQSAESFAKIVSNIDASMLYFDGSPFPGLPDMSTELVMDYEHQIGVIPYMRAIENEITTGNKDNFPLIQAADQPWSVGTTYLFKKASDDGVVFKNKDNLKYWKLYLIERDWNPYARTVHEIGWWNFHGTAIGSGRYDYDAVTLDDLEYAFGKALAYETSISVHLEESFNSYKHARINEFLSKIYMYQDFAKYQFLNKTIPASMLAYLRNVSHEAVLTNVSGYQLIEKKFYRFVSKPGETSFTFDNPFAQQDLLFELRPRFDYYDPNNSSAGHLLISNFNNIPQTNVRTSSSYVTCTINSSGSVTVTNTGSTVGGCEITIPSSPGSLVKKRGLSLDLQNNGGNEFITVRLSSPPAVRDFNYLLDPSFTAEKTIILGEPTGNAFDYVNGIKVDWQGNTWKSRNWELDYGLVSNIKVYINNIPPNTSLSNPRIVRFVRLQALQEKNPTTIFMPKITLNGQTFGIPVNLTIGNFTPYIFSLENNGSYRVYSENYTLLEQGRLSNLPKVLAGINTLQIQPSETGGERIDVRIELYDDKDKDGIPDRGAFDTPAQPCDEGESFCSDNCPDDYNPDQQDTNNNGVGDACDIRSGLCGDSVCDPDENPISCYFDCAPPLVLGTWGADLGLPITAENWTEYLSVWSELKNMGFTHAGVAPSWNGYQADLIADLRALDLDVIYRYSPNFNSILSGSDSGLQFFNAPGFDPSNCVPGICGCTGTPIFQSLDPAYSGALWQQTMSNLQNSLSLAQTQANDVLAIDAEAWRGAESVEFCYSNQLPVTNSIPPRYNGSDIEERKIEYRSHQLNRASDLNTVATQIQPTIKKFYYFENIVGWTDAWDDYTYWPAGSGDNPSPTLYYIGALYNCPINCNGTRITCRTFSNLLTDPSFGSNAWAGSYPWISFQYSIPHIGSCTPPEDARWDPRVTQKAGYLMKQANISGAIVYPGPPPIACSGCMTREEYLNHSQAFTNGFLLGLDPGQLEEVCGDGLDNNGDAVVDENCTVCGNGLIEGIEQCDDGNTDSGDGCSGVCTIENSPDQGEGGDGGDEGPGDQCIPNWQCSDWSECANGARTRSCNDLKNCDSLEGKPPTIVNCDYEQLTGFEDGEESNATINTEGEQTRKIDLTKPFIYGVLIGVTILVTVIILLLRKLFDKTATGRINKKHL
jgi:cysteine-rich repeat protein